MQVRNCRCGEVRAAYCQSALGRPPGCQDAYTSTEMSRHDRAASPNSGWKGPPVGATRTIASRPTDMKSSPAPPAVALLLGALVAACGSAQQPTNSTPSPESAAGAPSVGSF